MSSEFQTLESSFNSRRDDDRAVDMAGMVPVVSEIGWYDFLG